MKQKENNNFIKLFLAIITLLLIIIIGLLAMPTMDSARRKAFKVEATKIIDASKSAMSHYSKGDLSLFGLLFTIFEFPLLLRFKFILGNTC